MSNFSCYIIWVHKLSKYTIRFMNFSCYTIWVQQRPARQTLPSGHGRECHQGYRRHVSRSLCIHKPSSPDIDARPPLCSTLAMTVHLHARLRPPLFTSTLLFMSGVATGREHGRANMCLGAVLARVRTLAQAPPWAGARTRVGARPCRRGLWLCHAGQE